jgi:hypothetical protein
MQRICHARTQRSSRRLSLLYKHCSKTAAFWGVVRTSVGAERSIARQVSTIASIRSETVLLSTMSTTSAQPNAARPLQFQIGRSRGECIRTTFEGDEDTSTNRLETGVGHEQLEPRYHNVPHRGYVKHAYRLLLGVVSADTSYRQTTWIGPAKQPEERGKDQYTAPWAVASRLLR